jgi:transcriptional regulator with XRE-family HTH domain
MELAKALVQKGRVSDFRSLLQLELTARCQKNPNYSLRSFARSLQVEPSALSQIINGKRPLTQKMRLRLGTALGLSLHEIKEIPITKDEDTDDRKTLKYQEIGLDAFAAISDWYHYAILELTYVEGFKPDSSWISKRLGITKSETNIAIERLFRLGLLKKTKNGQWTDASENGVLSHIHPSLTSSAAKKYQKQLLELSSRSLVEDPIQERNHTSATFCFDTDDLPRAIEEISKFRRKFAAEFQPKKKAKQVYQLQISFFPLSHETKEQG